MPEDATLELLESWTRQAVYTTGMVNEACSTRLLLKKRWNTSSKVNTYVDFQGGTFSQ